MHLRHADGTLVHLAYGTNVHPAEDLDGIIGQLDTYAAAVRRRLDVAVLGLGMWLAAPAAAALAADPATRRRLRRELDTRGLEVVTLNGFPYQAFHAPVVKHAVYRPDWADPSRLEYTMNLATILVDLLPDGAARGSISTLPLGWREPWDARQETLTRRALDELATRLAALRHDSGRPVRVAFEPEPGCVVETSVQAVARLSTVDTDHLGVCLDLAHLACAWEDPATVVSRLAAARLPIVKVQVSSALEVADPDAAVEALRRYVEPKFLHQVRSRDGAALDDLDEALTAPVPGPWRIHFHVPLHAAPEPPVVSTNSYLAAALAVLMGGPAALCDHLEVETYTWSVLPPAQRPADAGGLAAGIAAELAYAGGLLRDLGLKPVEVGTS